MYRSAVLPGPAIMFALGLYAVVSQGGSSVNTGSRGILILC